MKWRVLAIPFGIVALAASIDCSNSTTLLCPQSGTNITANEACPTEGLVCPYVGGSFDQYRTDSTSDCFNDFVEYACTQKKWVLTAQAATTFCQLDTTGALASGDTSCTLGLGRCALPAGTVLCQSVCQTGATNSYSGSCVSGQLVVASTSCNPDRDAGIVDEDASANDDASVEDAATDAGDE